MRAKKDTCITYMGHLQNAWYDSELVEQREINTLLNQFRHFGNVIHHSLPLFYAIDYTARQYLVLTDAMQTLAGYHPRDFMENKLQKLLEVYHKDDFKIYNKEVFARNVAFLKKTPQHLHSEHLFSYNFRFRRSDNQYAHVLQRNTYITSKQTGLPLYSLGVIIDINDVKTDTVIVHTIERTSAGAGFTTKNLVEKNYFYPNEDEATFTRRETDVLKYLAEGLNSKQIAGKLHLSTHTVIAHKQNMLHKANAKNTTELVVAAARNRVI